MYIYKGSERPAESLRMGHFLTFEDSLLDLGAPGPGPIFKAVKGSRRGSEVPRKPPKGVWRFGELEVRRFGGSEVRRFGGSEFRRCGGS